jgi:protoporphyrinogen oxidase
MVGSGRDYDAGGIREGHAVEHAVLGAGPAGLTSAYVLALRGCEGAVFEASDQVGGLARTEVYKGYRFDLGGHRFFTKLTPISRLWRSVLGDDFLLRPRLSRIYYRDGFLAYPLQAKDVLGRLGAVESIRCVLSYLASRGAAAPTGPETFEDWVTRRFGKRLYAMFFASYTEKVWGIPGSEIDARWAAQRIKNLSFKLALLEMLGLGRAHVTTLIDQFYYPRLGPGQMWEAFQSRLEDAGIPVLLQRRCVAVNHAAGRVASIDVVSCEPGRNGDAPVLTRHPVAAVLSSVPLRELVLSLRPAAPAAVQAAARKLRYRSLCLVALITTQEEPFPDNWIYLHDPGVRAGRVQNFGAWSPDLVVAGTTCLGVEYFCDEGDDLWQLTDADAVNLARQELASIGVLDPDTVIDGVRVRVPKAYPMYDGHYDAAVAVLSDYLGSFENLGTFGRNGLHRYNNQDHSMWTAILATLNEIDGAAHDVWSVNTEADYHEAGELIDVMLNVELAPT